MLPVILRGAPTALAAAVLSGAVLAGAAIAEEGPDKSKSKATEQVLLGTGELTSGIPAKAR